MRVKHFLGLNIKQHRITGQGNHYAPLLPLETEESKSTVNHQVHPLPRHHPAKGVGKGREEGRMYAEVVALSSRRPMTGDQQLKSAYTTDWKSLWRSGADVGWIID